MVDGYSMDEHLEHSKCLVYYSYRESQVLLAVMLWLSGVVVDRTFTSGSMDMHECMLILYHRRVTVETRYSKPLKCGHLVLTDVLLRYGLHSINMQPYIITPEIRTPRYYIKLTSSSVFLIPGLYIIHWIMQTLTCLSCKLVHNG